MVRITLKPSRLLAAALVAAHAGAAATLVPIELALWGKALVVLAIAASLACALRRHAWLKSGGSITAIELLGDDRAAFETQDGPRCEARVLGTTFVTPRLCVMNLEVAGKRRARSVILVTDNVEADAFRRLRVELRWGYATGR